MATGITPSPAGSIAAVGLMRSPNQGAQCAPYLLDFTVNGTVQGDLGQIYQSGVFDFAQSLFIDNSANTAPITITFPGLGPKGQSVVAQPYTQGWYPVAVPMGDGRWSASTTTGQLVPINFANVPMPYVVWGPIPGVLVVPALTNGVLNFAPLAVGDNQIIGAALLKTNKTYRMWLTFAQPANVQFFDGPSANNNPLTGVIPMFGGGTIALQASGVPWFTDAVDTALIMTSSAAVNAGGNVGYVQS